MPITIYVPTNLILFLVISAADAFVLTIAELAFDVLADTRIQAPNRWYRLALKLVYAISAFILFIAFFTLPK